MKVNGKAWNSTPRHPKTPEPMTTKIGTGDYVPDIYPCAKLHFDPIKGFCSPCMRSCLSNVHSASFLGVLPIRYPWGRCADFDAQCVKRRRFAQRYAFGDPKTKVYILTSFSQKKNKILSRFSMGQKISAQNGLQHGWLHQLNTLKTTSYAFGSWMLNRQSTATNQNMWSVSTQKVDWP